MPLSPELEPSGNGESNSRTIALVPGLSILVNKAVINNNIYNYVQLRTII